MPNVSEFTSISVWYPKEKQSLSMIAMMTTLEHRDRVALAALHVQAVGRNQMARIETHHLVEAYSARRTCRSRFWEVRDEQEQTKQVYSPMSPTKRTSRL